MRFRPILARGWRVALSATLVLLFHAAIAAAQRNPAPPERPRIGPEAPMAARVAARGPRTNARAAERAAKARAAGAALGLENLTLGGDASFPGAIYGEPGSGVLRGNSPSDKARAFMTAFAPYYGVTPAALKDMVIEERPGFIPGHHEVLVRRSIEGRPVYGAQVRLHLGPDGEFVGAIGDYYGPLAWAGEPSMNGEGARERAARAVEMLQKRTDTSPRRGANADRSRVDEVAYPLGETARPAFVVSSVVAMNGVDIYDVVVDGLSGETLEISPRTFYAQGQVFRSAGLVPQSPQPSTTPGIVPPSPNPPAFVSRVTIPFTVFGTELSGNNAMVREFQAWTGYPNPTPADGNAIVAAGGDFSFPLLLGATDVRQFPKATGTNLYYILNAARDYFYALGFDEAHGNFQVDNFGLGGFGGDPVVAFTQLGSGPADGQYATTANNAWMNTPSDGTSPIMGMYVWAGEGAPPGRIYTADSSLDPDIVIHEFTHGVTRRLSSGYLPYSSQAGAINEGNSDFFALNMQIPSTAPLDGSYPVGTYSVRNFTWGIRNFPYSTDLAVNPLTYAWLGSVGWWGPEVHDDGEIWTTTMWEVRAGLIAALGYSTGRTRAAQLLVDALQLLPDFPTFVDLRNAILAADGFRYANADRTLLWQAFAKRGLGTLASGGFYSESIHVLPSSAVRSNAAKIALFDPEFVAGEYLRVLVADANAASSNVTLTTNGGDSEILALDNTPQAFSGMIGSAFGTAVPGDGILQFIGGQTITATTTDANTGGGTPTLTTTATGIDPMPITMLGSSMFSEGDAPTLLFQYDEWSESLPLPFPFPFLGEEYSFVEVSDNGFLSLQWPRFFRARGLSEIGLPAMIAPFSVDLDCRPGYGSVYYYSGSDRLTVRWNCVEYTTSNVANVAVTLFPNGSIRFDYGPGNLLTVNDFYTGSPNYATVGIARGTDTFWEEAIYHGATNLGNASSLFIAPNAVPAIPTGINARAVTSASILVTWNAVSGATAYQVERKGAGGAWTTIATTYDPAYTDTVPGGLAFLYRVRATNGPRTSGPSGANLATSIVFVDDPLTAGDDIRAPHIWQLRTGIDAVRALAALGAGSFSTMAAIGSVVQAADVIDARAALGEARTKLGLSNPAYTNDVVAGAVVKGVDLQELRNRLK